jgi:hypothetical protein
VIFKNYYLPFFLEILLGAKKDILGLRRNSLIRKPFKLYPPPKEEGLGVVEVLLNSLFYPPSDFKNFPSKKKTF